MPGKCQVNAKRAPWQHPSEHPPLKSDQLKPHSPHFGCWATEPAQMGCPGLLCMHWRGQGPGRDPAKKQPRVRSMAAAFVWVPALVPRPSSACTIMWCMRKSVVHVPESSRILGMNQRNKTVSIPVILRITNPAKVQECYW